MLAATSGDRSVKSGGGCTGNYDNLGPPRAILGSRYTLSSEHRELVAVVLPLVSVRVRILESRIVCL